MTHHNPALKANLNKTILWWGRHGNYGPDYPRNRTIIQCLQDLGCKVIEFQPRLSLLGHIEAQLKGFSNIDLVWVPCFRQRDLSAASKWARKRNIPLVFDPLISAYDKRVNEKKKYAADSLRAKRLLTWEKKLFHRADALIADTLCHKDYFARMHQCPAERVHVIPVSAEESLFFPSALPESTNGSLEALFLGTFIDLQGPQYIAQAARFYQGPPLRLTFLGTGPLRADCEAIAANNQNPLVTITFEDWIPFHTLPDRIRRAHLCLGVFGSGEKSARVIPNKVYQSLACGRPVVTMAGDAYPDVSSYEHKGIWFCPPASPEKLGETLSNAAASLSEDKSAGEAAYALYQQHFSNDQVKNVLSNILQAARPNRMETTGETA